ncbi:hypothetical protein QCA50_008176 [Cerrena zonata]|uniref:DUF6535 domain-containing protein n=1 Tax=Cerrena zonata TaxID=2478898 RepID=A0AAW0GEV6_9APHY
MKHWQVFELASFLPLLLQLALLLFFIGLGLFLHDLNSLVGWITTAVMLFWFSFFLLTTIAPVFSSQCPCKTPILKELLRHIRHISHAWPLHLAHRLYDSTIELDCRYRTKSLYLRLKAWAKAWEANEEEFVCKAQGWDFPTLADVDNILQGKQLGETFRECLRECVGEDMARCIQDLNRDDPSQYANHNVTIPDRRKGRLSDIFLDAINKNEHPIMRVGNVHHQFVFQQLYIGLTFSITNSYDLFSDFPIPGQSLPMVVQAIQDGPTSAAFSILTMYTIQLRTTNGHFRNLFLPLSPQERESYEIGNHFGNNLVAATRTLIHSLWNHPQPDSDIEKIVDCVTEIQRNTKGSDFEIPLDPVVLTYVFAIVLEGLTPEAVIRKHSRGIFKVMRELAELLTRVDGSAWTYSRRECVEWACVYLQRSKLSDEYLRPRLSDLIRTWNPDWPLA